MVSGRRFFLLSLARAAGAAVPVPVYAAGALAILLALALRIRHGRERTTRGDLQGAAALATVFAALLSTHYLWYFGWLAVFLPVVPAVPLVYLTAAATFLFAALGPRTFGRDGPPIFDTTLYLPAAALALGAVATRGREALAPSGGRRRHPDGEDTGRRADLGGADLAGTET
jgi:hypothetical protein